MLDGLFSNPAVGAIKEALSSAGVGEGAVAVIGDAKLAAALAADRKVIPVAVPERAAKKLSGVVGAPSDVEAGSLEAVIGVDVATDDAWAATLRTWSRLVRDGGALVFVDRGHAAEASRRALCAGLTELEQRHAGRSVVTSGLVTIL